MTPDPGPVVVTLSRTTAAEPLPVAAFVGQPDGTVTMLILRPSVAAGSLRHGVHSARLNRMIRMEDGHAFLDALADSVAGSPYWEVTSA